MRKLLTIVLLLISATVFSQTAYHVAKTGSDATGDGSSGNPWLTITFGEASMSGGDTLFVHAGTYVERVVIIGIDGTPSARTVFKTYGTDVVKIDGQNAGTDSEGDIVRIYDDYVDFYGFELQNSNQDKGVGTALGHGMELRGDHISVSYCTIHDCLLNGITGTNGDSTIIEYCTFYDLSLDNYNGNSTSGFWGGGVILTGVAGTPITTPIFRHNLCYDVWGEGLTVRYSTNALFEDNTIYNCFSVALYVQNTRYAKVQRNLVYSTGPMQNDKNLDNAEVGIGLWDESLSEPTVSRVTVINNLVYGCDRNFVDYAGDTVAVIGNTFVNSISTTHNVQLGTGGLTFTKGYYANNIIDENDGTAPTNLIGIYGSGTNNITFKNNLYSRALSGEYELPASDATDVEDDPELQKTGSTAAGELTALYFKVGASSPAISAGQDMDDLLGIYYDTTNVYKDYLQYIRTAAPTIGALEVSGDPPTPPIAPTVQTLTVNSYNAVSATLRGVVVSDGGGTISANGICWGTSENPTISNSRVDFTAGLTSMSIKITTLKSNTTYHVRAYATNETGTSYGDDVSFTTPAQSVPTQNGRTLKHYGKTAIVK